jgi:hypothetical protein
MEAASFCGACGTKDTADSPTLVVTPKKIDLNEDEEHTKFLHYCSH